MIKNFKAIPDPVVKRLAKYLAHVQHLSKRSLKWIPSHKLAQHLGLTSVTVRQDLSYLDFNGVGKRGYLTAGLEKTLTEFFDANTESRVVVVGAGNIGQSIVRNKEFQRQGYQICAIIDVDPKIIGKKIATLKVQHMDELRDIISTNNIKIGIIAVPAGKAQTVADQLILLGIQGILNLSSMHIASPKSVHVVNVRVINGLRELVISIKQSKLKKLIARSNNSIH